MGRSQFERKLDGVLAGVKDENEPFPPDPGREGLTFYAYAIPALGVTWRYDPIADFSAVPSLRIPSTMRSGAQKEKLRRIALRPPSSLG